VIRLCITKNDHDLDKSICSLGTEECQGYNQEQLDGILNTFSHVFVDTPGQTDIVEMELLLEPGTRTISQAPYHISDKVKAVYNKRYI